MIRLVAVEVELEDEEELASFSLYAKCLDKRLIHVVEPEPVQENLVDSIVSMIADGNLSVVDSDEDECVQQPAEEAV